jgi:hypothetical protein
VSFSPLPLFNPQLALSLMHFFALTRIEARVLAVILLCGALALGVWAAWR